MGEPDKPARAEDAGALGATAPAAGAPDGGDAPARVGDVVGGRYELLAELGRGGWGIVFRARDRVADEVVALKLLARHLQSTDAVARVRRELRAARKVTHPCVVRIHDAIEVDGRLALSMELVEGETLEALLLRERRLSAAAVASLAADLARALAAAHEAGVTHRDLKPANILVRRSTGRAVITDFGISRLAQLADAATSGEAPSDLALTREGALVGTPLYMSPEQLAGAADVGPAADVFAAGVVLYECATGQLPHRASSLAELHRARLADDRPRIRALRPDLPDSLRQTIERCLSPDARDRYADGMALKAELEGFLGSGEFTGKIALAPQGRRTRTALAVAAATIVVFAAGLATFMLARRTMPLPAHDRRVAVVAQASGADAWLAPAVERLAARALARREPRVTVVDDAAQANVILSLRVAQVGEGVTLASAVGPARGRPRPLVELRAPAAAAAVDRLVDAAAPVVGAGQGAVDGARRTRRQYDAIVDQAFGAVWFDAGVFRRALDDLLARDPGWAHPYALLLQAQGEGSPGFAATLARARQAIVPARDRAGAAIIDALERSSRGDRRGAVQLLDGVYRADPDDLVAGWNLARLLEKLSEREEGISVYRALHERRPDLQFGADLEAALRAAGRAGEVPAVQARWLARAPEGEQALASAVGVDLAAGKLDDAVVHARRTVVLYGAAHRMGTLADVLLLAGSLAEAARVVDEMVRGSQQERVAGFYRRGQIAVLQGRFATAEEAFHSSAAEARSFGVLAHVSDALAELRTLATLQRRDDERARFDDELAAIEARLGNGAAAALARFDAALARRGGGACPPIARALDGLDAATAHGARRAMARAAALAGCGACADVVRAGLSTDEGRIEPLYDFALCAEQTRALELARDVLDGVRQPRTTTSDPGALGATTLAVLAELHRGRVLEELGDHAGARAAYQAFLERWGHADRPLDEVAAARRELKALPPPETR